MTAKIPGIMRAESFDYCEVVSKPQIMFKSPASSGISLLIINA